MIVYLIKLECTIIFIYRLNLTQKVNQKTLDRLEINPSIYL